MNKNRRAPMGMGRGRGNNEKAKDLGGTLKKLLAYLKPYHFKICFVMVFAVCSTIFNIIGPKVLAKATDKLSEGIMAKVANTGGIDFNNMYLPLSKATFILAEKGADLETAKKAGAVFAYGAFLTDFLQFLILAFVVFCLIRQLNKLIPIPKEPPKTKICPFCKSEIPHEATKCAHCTSDLPTT